MAENKVMGVEYSEAAKDSPETLSKMEYYQGYFNYAIQKSAFDAKYRSLSSRSGFMDKVVDLTQMDGLAAESWGSVLKAMEQGLRAVDGAGLTLAKGSSGGYVLSAESQQKIDDELIHTVMQMIPAIQSLKSLSGQSGVVNKKNFENFLSRFYTQKGEMRAFFKRLSSGEISSSDAQTFIREFVGRARIDIGFMMEDIVSHMMASKPFGEFMLEETGRAIASVKTQNVTAQPGTIRAYVKGQSLNKSGNPMQGSPTGQPLRDATITWQMGSGGKGRITVNTKDPTTGISVKRYSMSGGSANIKIAGVSVGNFADVMLSLKEDAIYGYRVFKAQGGGEKNGVAHWLARNRLEELYFGQTEETDLPISDRTELMVVNGHLMSVETFMKMSEPTVSAHGFSSKKSGEFILPRNVQQEIGQIHAMKLHLYAKLNADKLFAK